MYQKQHKHFKDLIEPGLPQNSPLYPLAKTSVFHFQCTTIHYKIGNSVLRVNGEIKAAVTARLFVISLS